MNRIIAIASIAVFSALLAGCDKQVQRSDIAQLQQHFGELESRVETKLNEMKDEIEEIKGEIEEIKGEVESAADADDVEKIQKRVEVLESNLKRLR
jgi:septal ring factor EnvC (AmiA/AmiB activator)